MYKRANPALGDGYSDTSARNAQLLSLLGALPAGAGGALMAPPGEALQTGLRTGGGSFLGGLGGGALGGLGGYALGAGLGPLMGDKNHELAELLAALGAGAGVLGGRAYGARKGMESAQANAYANASSLSDPSADPSQKQAAYSENTMSRTNHAYAYGCAIKLAEQNITPDAFVQYAAQTNVEILHKIANALIELDAHLTKTADRAGTFVRAANGFADGVGEALGHVPLVGGALQRGLGHTGVQQARGAVDSARGGMDSASKALYDAQDGLHRASAFQRAPRAEAQALIDDPRVGQDIYNRAADLSYAQIPGARQGLSDAEGAYNTSVDGFRSSRDALGDAMDSRINRTALATGGLAAASAGGAIGAGHHILGGRAPEPAPEPIPQGMRQQLQALLGR